MSETTNNMEQSHKQMISVVIESHFGKMPTLIKRMTTGICNEVYAVSLPNREVIIRLSSVDKFLMGSHDHIPQLKKLGIKVPEILAQDYSRTTIPLAYQIQSKIEGTDLGDAIETLTDNELHALAHEIFVIFDKIRTIATDGEFGVIWGGGDNDVSETWTERMRLWIDESYERGKKTGIMNESLATSIEKVFIAYKPYFDSVKAVTYYGDICSKNVMIHNGVFNGLVDLDGLTQGDPLEAIGRIRLSWYGTRHGTLYSDAIMDEMNLTADQRKIVTLYAFLNQISWACENGIQFNQNTRPVIDREKEQKDKAIIKILMTELQ